MFKNFDFGLLDNILLGNSIRDYFFCALILFVGFVFKQNFSKYISKFLFDFALRSKKLNSNDFYSIIKKPLDYLVILIFAFFSVNHLNFSLIFDKNPNLEFVFSKLFSLLIMLLIIWLFLRVTDFFKLIMTKKAEKTKSKLDDQLIPFFGSLIKVFIIIFGLFTIVGSVFNVDITALAAGLGVGGIAIAMAAKESLENLFGSFVIFLDRPFTVGDTVTVGTTTGIIESVGFRSTRIRTFDKSLVTVPNKKMVDAEVDNLGMRPSRRSKFNIGLTYSTSKTQIKKITKDIKNIIDKHPKTEKNFSRVKFVTFGASSLDIMVMFYVKGTDWDDYLQTTEEINFSIMDVVKKHKSDFAFPSTTVFLNK